MMHKYIKRETHVEAFQITQERRADNKDWPEWLHDAWNKQVGMVGYVGPSNYLHSNGEDKLIVETFDGSTLVEWGDWIVKHGNRDLMVYTDKRFNELYRIDD